MPGMISRVLSPGKVVGIHSKEEGLGLRLAFGVWGGGGGWVCCNWSIGVH